MIPDFQTIMLPLLKFISDGKTYHSHDIFIHLSKEFNLTEEELNEYVPSGQQKVFVNRISWAKSYLKMAKFIETIKKSELKITESGKNAIQKFSDGINIKALKQIPEFQEHRKTETLKNSVKNSASLTEENNILETPEEQIESGYQNIRKSLEIELLTKLKSVDPYFFERIVVELLVKMGYGGSIQDAGKAIGKSGDEGIDGIIKEDKLGLDVIYIQAKRWQGVVGRPEVQKFVGALAGQRAKKGVFITTSYFTKEAIDYALQMDTKVVLIDGEKLAQYMIDYNLGVSVQNIYEIKKIDSDYFEED
jgi:restriction system protein